MKKVLAAVLTCALVLSSVYAAGFSDISKHWAKDYINDIGESGIVKGYDDGTFKPDRKVTKSESVLMMYRLYDTMGLVDKDQEQVLVNRYKGIMDKNSIAKWTGLREAVAYFLEHNIVPESDLEDFMRGNNHVNMTRERVSYYLGKSLNMFLDKKVGGIIESVFKDMQDINGVYLQYIDFLFKNKIISGDNNGNFNPKNSITRAEFTKLIVESMRVLKENKSAEETSVKASVATKLDSLNKVVFHDIADKSKTYEELIDKDVTVTIGGEPAEYKDLIVDMIANLSYVNGKLVKVEADEIVYDTVVRSGEVTDITADRKYFYFKDSVSNKTVFVEMSAGIPVQINGKAGSFSDATVGSYAILSYKKEDLIGVDFRTKTEKLEGVLKSIEVGENAKITLKIGEAEKTITLAKDAKIMRNELVATLSDLKVDDTIIVETEYGKVKAINASANTTLVSGKLEKISKGEKNSITLVLADKTSKAFEIADSVIVKVDGKKAGLFDLKIDYFIKLKYDGETLVSVIAESEQRQRGYTGTINKIHADVKVLVIETDSAYYSVSVGKDTLVLDSKGAKISFADLKEGQRVFAYGIKSEVYLNASKLIVLD